MRYLPAPITPEQLEQLKRDHGDDLLGPYKPSPQAHPDLVVWLRYPTRSAVHQFRAYKAAEGLAPKANEVFASACIVHPPAAQHDRLWDTYPAADVVIANTLLIAGGFATEGIAQKVDEATALRAFRDGAG